ncbi:hypothetical protein H6P87_00082 [Rickettsia tillamookensis]|uniref:Ankyrin repeat protein n=1 Tax=Rickettsia tillamookensis TaxID=2761623 RepID=A0A9E6SPX0_9RICK|nr:ankyrin repeat domain-containing protein [Rickettsia tillamookensis]QQV74548.1 hypothetical protein H6P87_00082 [Rickettsia tillamookensis]
MKSLWNISWSQYSWRETWQIFKAYSSIIVDDTGPTSFNSNILHIAAKSCNLELLKKILDIENGIDINEQDKMVGQPCI